MHKEQSRHKVRWRYYSVLLSLQYTDIDLDKDEFDYRQINKELEREFFESQVIISRIGNICII